ncbi:MAG: PAS domain-containing protein, partial [Proteobacteria bacterium]|nr:PAS domain-containing protein [Pseudomonadota bacterium]
MRRRGTRRLTEKTNLNYLEKPVCSTQIIFLPHERGIAMSSNPADKKLATKIKDLELKLAAPQLISEEFRRLANRSRDIIYRYDLTTRQFLFFNKTFLEFYGIDAESGREVTTKSVLLSIYPEDRDKVKKAQKKSLAPGSTGGEVEYRQIRPDGSLHWMHDRWIVITDETGNPVILEGIIRDNTEHKRLEEQQRRDRESAERLAEEIAVIAEIGQVISSTLDIAEVYERFAAETRKLIPFDSLIVNLKKPGEDTLDVAYASGEDIPERRKGDSFPLKGSVSEVAMRTRTGLIVRSEDILKKTDRFATLGVVLRAGLYSMMGAPLISRNEAIGSLIFRAEK